MNAPIRPRHIIIVAVGLGLTVAIGLYTAIELNTNTENNLISACRSQYSAEANDARDVRQKAIYEGLGYLGRHDDAGLANLAEDQPRVNRNIDIRNRQYKAAIQLSKVDPGKFLAACQK